MSCFNILWISLVCSIERENVNLPKRNPFRRWIYSTKLLSNSLLSSQVELLTEKISQNQLSSWGRWESQVLAMDFECRSPNTRKHQSNYLHCWDNLSLGNQHLFLYRIESEPMIWARCLHLYGHHSLKEVHIDAFCSHSYPKRMKLSPQNTFVCTNSLIPNN